MGAGAGEKVCPGRWFAFAVLVCMRRPGLHAPPWSACAALVCMRPGVNEIQQPSNLEKTSRHMANIRSTIPVAARSGSTIPSYRLNFINTKIRSTIASAGRFKEVALQRILPPPIGFEVLVQAGLAAKIGQNP